MNLETKGANEELRKCPPLITYALANTSNNLNANLENVFKIDSYGSKVHLLRVTATVLEVTEILMKRRKDKPSRVMAQDLARAMVLWVKTIQYQSFEGEYQQLKEGRKEVTLKQLCLFMYDGVIHCQGRINRASVPITSKNPILLPPKH